MSDEETLPDGFPFTIDELRTAAERWIQGPVAEQVLSEVVDDAKSTVARYSEFAERWRQQGRDPSILRNFYIRDEILAHLAVMSPSTAERVRAIKEARWAEVRTREIEAERRRSAERAGLIPSLDDILDEAERRGDFSWDDPRVFEGMAMAGKLPEPPEATSEVIAIAEANVALDIAEWEELVEAARAGLPLPVRAYAISDFEETMPEDELPDREPNWQFIDEYIDHYDRWRSGYGRLFATIARDLKRFNTELVRALRIAPARAIPRVVMYHLLGGYNNPIEATSAVGAAFTAANISNGPALTTNRGEPHYECANLLEWFETNRNQYEHYALFDEWRRRKRTRREVSWMRLVRDRYDEVVPWRHIDEAEQ